MSLAVVVVTQDLKLHLVDTACNITNESIVRRTVASSEKIGC
jgi:hypothetical protein